MSKYIHVYDCEMSGPYRETSDIISLSCIVAKADTLEEVATYDALARPDHPEAWSSRAEAVHGITLEKAMEQQSQKDLALGLLHFLKDFKNEDDSPMPFVMHSVSFVDYRFIKMLYDKLSLSRSFEKVASERHTIRTDMVFREWLKLNNKPSNKTNLRVMAEEFRIKLDHHNSKSDTHACHQALAKMAPFFKERGGLYHPTVDFSGFNYMLEFYKG